MEKKELKYLMPVACLAAVIALIASSFADLEYFEMGFKRSVITGSVDRSHVFEGGRHWFGPGYDFKVFNFSAHLVSFENESVFNYEKFEVLLTCSLQYYLVKEDLHLLHDKYDIHYAPVLRNLLLAAIKNNAANFTVDQYRLERVAIEKKFHQAAEKALGGTCCLPDCTGNHFCLENCKNRSTCIDEDKGAFAEVRFLQLKAIQFSSSELYQRFLRQTTLLEKQDTEEFIKREKVYRKETEQLKRQILVDAAETIQNASIKAIRMKELANVEAVRNVEEARTDGLSRLYATLNMTFEHHKNSMDYVRTLRNQPNSSLYLGFKTVVPFRRLSWNVAYIRSSLRSHNKVWVFPNRYQKFLSLFA